MLTPTLPDNGASFDARQAAALEQIDFGGIHRTTRDRILPRYPSGMRRYLTSDYLATANARAPNLPGWSLAPWMAADERLRTRHRHLRRGFSGPSFDADELHLKAKSCARMTLLLMRGKDQNASYRAAARYAAEQGIEPPTPNGVHSTVQGCCRRLLDPSWWRRKLKKAIYQRSEAVERELGLVQACAGLYASDDAVKRRQQDKARSRAFLEACIAVSDTSDSLSLADIADANVSNPKIRRAEFMTRIRGFEEYANHHGHLANFLTLTTPSRFHAYRRHGDLNSKWDESTPAEGQQWLNRIWAQIRAALQRSGIIIYGFRVAEPHHDGTPHWHMLLFCLPRQEQELLRIFKRYMLADSADEPGAQKHRFTTVRIDKTRGSATGYFSKYVAKNIDGHAVGTDAEDTRRSRDANDTVQRVETWSSTWAIRQFQQIGGPPVGVWRELRHVDQALHGSLEKARHAADSGDWCAYMMAMGGHQTSFRSCAIKILRVWLDKPGIYDDPIGFVVVGIQFGRECLVTRLREWRIERIGTAMHSRTC